jgi:AmiR/NasT family two-component response regulator
VSRSREVAGLLDDRALVSRAEGVMMERHQVSARAARVDMTVCAHKLGIELSLVASAVLIAAERAGVLGRT